MAETLITISICWIGCKLSQWFQFLTLETNFHQDTILFNEFTSILFDW